MAILVRNHNGRGSGHAMLELEVFTSQNVKLNHQGGVLSLEQRVEGTKLVLQSVEGAVDGHNFFQ